METPVCRVVRSCLLAVLFVGTCVPGCGPKPTRIDLTTFDEAGNPRRHYTDFSRAAYQLSPGNVLEVVLRSARPSQTDPTQTITQILYLKTLWSPRLGITYAEATQINARAQYAILTPLTGVRYDGSAFVSYQLNARTGELTGSIESGSLTPRWRFGETEEPFGPARLTGTFTAGDNPREVVKAVQLLESQFHEPIDRRGP